jgi:PncC family amidohydrolase
MDWRQVTSAAAQGSDALFSLAGEIGAALSVRGQTVAVSESSSGGLISAALLSVPGASRFYRGAGVIYTPQAFRGLLGLTRDDMEGLRSSTEPYARLLAGVIRTRLQADWGLCETGAAGPDGNIYGDAAGHSCMAVSGPGGLLASTTLETRLADRHTNMFLFAAEALRLLGNHLA